MLTNEKNDREATTIKLTNKIDQLKSNCKKLRTQAKIDKEKIQSNFDDYGAKTEAVKLKNNQEKGKFLQLDLQKEWKDRTELMDELNAFATEVIGMDQELNEKNNVLCMYKSLAEQAFSATSSGDICH